MSFWQRLRFFLIGFIPGCIILIMIVNKKGCTSPNELKVLELSHQQFILGEKAACKLKCLLMTETEFKADFKNLKVNYDVSDVHKKPYGTYYLKPIDAKNARYEVLVEDRDTTTYVTDIKLLKTLPYCSCDSTLINE